MRVCACDSVCVCVCVGRRRRGVMVNQPQRVSIVKYSMRN